MCTPRVLTAAAVLATVLTVAVAVVAAQPGHHVVRREAAPTVSVTEPCASRARIVLEEWDRQRARAWASGSAMALAGLYTADSRTAGRDAAMLGAYRARGLRVRSLHRQVLGLHVRACRADRLSLVVTDRLAEGLVTGAGERLALPSSRPATRTLVLRRVAGAWRVAEVYAD